MKHESGPRRPVGPSEVDDFADLVREHQAGLRAFIRALGVDSDWVDDLAQETFVTAFLKRAQFETGKDFGRWLRGIARHLIANERRKRARHARILGGAMTEMLLAAEQEPESAALVAEPHILKALNECVERLSEQSRALLRQRYATGEKAPALAVAFRQSPDAIRQSLSRIRRAVKACVENKLGEAWR